MDVTACLAWYDEPTDALAAMAASLAGVCSRLVAVDGRWNEFPGDTHLSPRAQPQRLKTVCRRVGVDVTVARPGRAWRSQVEKRAALMRLAAPGADWLLVIDADETIHCPDPARLHAELAATPADVARVMLRTVGGGARQEQRAVRRLYRASTGVTVETAHNGYRAADGRWLHGDPAYVALADPVDLSGLIVLEHNLEARPRERRGRSQVYRDQRRRLQLEAWA